MQTTQIGSHVSKKAEITCGVPQGSFPLLFLLYINDIHSCSDKLIFYLFADDTNILYADKDLKSLELVVNTELQKLYDWLTSNKLTLNIKNKTKHEAKHVDFLVLCQPYQPRSAATAASPAAAASKLPRAIRNDDLALVVAAGYYVRPHGAHHELLERDQGRPRWSLCGLWRLRWLWW